MNGDCKIGNVCSGPSRLLKNAVHGLSLRGTEKNFALRRPTGARLGLVGVEGPFENPQRPKIVRISAAC